MTATRLRPNVLRRAGGVCLSLLILFTGCADRPEIGQRLEHAANLGPVAAASGASLALCVQTFNAYGPAYSSNIPGRTKAWGDDLAEDPCAIVQAQEVWSTAHFDLASETMSKSLPQMSAVHFDHRQVPYEGKAGLALFTNHVIADSSFESFAVNRDGLLDDIRSALGVIKGMGLSHVRLRTETSPGVTSESATIDHEINLLNLHTHPSSQGVRMAQMTQLLAQYDRMLPLRRPLIVTGDFNFEPAAVEYALLRDVMLLQDSYVAANGPYSGEECTYCAVNPHHWGGGDRVIDYIWYRNARHKALNARHSFINLLGTPSLTPSDHYGLRTLFDLEDRSSYRDDPAANNGRRLKAIATLCQALEILTAADHLDSSDGLRWAIMTVNSFKRRLNQSDPSDPLVAQFDIP
jgi:hypothetical protein